MTLNLTPKEEKRTVRCLLSTVFYDEISVIRETSDSTIVTNSATMLKTCKKKTGESMKTFTRSIL